MNELSKKTNHLHAILCVVWS